MLWIHTQVECDSPVALRRCEQMIQRYSREINSDGGMVGKAVEDCMRAIIGVLLNLTHDNESLSFFLRSRDLISECWFGLGLLINLVEYSARNRYFLMEMEMEGGQGPCDSTVMLSEHHQDLSSSGGPLSAIAALVQLFLQRERAAVLAEAQTDDLIKEAPKPALDQSGEWQETGGEIQWVANDNASDKQEEGKEKNDEEDEQLDLNKAYRGVVAITASVFVDNCFRFHQMNVTTVRENLPKGDFSIMTEMLKKFLNFMNLTCDVGTAGQKPISRIIDYLEHC
ncbi:hypothetical protein GOODEAATRI_005452 [Goodea atripinnis]|uniref:WAPL domain-containing protein n=1 Tax=Goodea atripinnis TaxID=208336 RepID=A0ABV0MYV9_9TELE